ncbi:unnamed protein product [Paramecium pentaurelia]|uniref:Uncharacterized protein n=1 Tax=Paramecium pentaurelia TaxID=43138 RepID=A0A8S1VB76_9CILI|nr:unnamed protein product [Paramecium pentaurelia]
MEMCKEDIMNLKGICLHHMMYKYYQYLNMSYKKYHKLSNQFQQQNSDLHKFSIQYQMCKQHSKQGRLNNLSQTYKTLEGKLSNYQKNYKNHIHQNKHHIYTLEKNNNLEKKYIKHYDKIVAYKSYMLRHLGNQRNQRDNPNRNLRFQLILDHNTKLLKYYQVSLHRQFIKIRKTVTMWSDIINKNIIQKKLMMQLGFYKHILRNSLQSINHQNQLQEIQINCNLQISTQNFFQFLTVVIIIRKTCLTDNNNYLYLQYSKILRIKQFFQM